MRCDHPGRGQAPALPVACKLVPCCRNTLCAGRDEARVPLRAPRRIPREQGGLIVIVGAHLHQLMLAACCRHVTVAAACGGRHCTTIALVRSLALPHVRTSALEVSQVVIARQTSTQLRSIRCAGLHTVCIRSTSLSDS